MSTTKLYSPLLVRKANKTRHRLPNPSRAQRPSPPPTQSTTATTAASPRKPPRQTSTQLSSQPTRASSSTRPQPPSRPAGIAACRRRGRQHAGVQEVARELLRAREARGVGVGLRVEVRCRGRRGGLGVVLRGDRPGGGGGLDDVEIV